MHDNFWNFKLLCSQIICDRTRNTNGEKVNWLKIKWLRFEKSHPFIIQNMYFLSSDGLMEINVIISVGDASRLMVWSYNPFTNRNYQSQQRRRKTWSNWWSLEWFHQITLHGTTMTCQRTIRFEIIFLNRQTMKMNLKRVTSTDHWPFFLYTDCPIRPWTMMTHFMLCCVTLVVNKFTVFYGTVIEIGSD